MNSSPARGEQADRDRPLNGLVSCGRIGFQTESSNPFDDIVDHCCYAWNTLIDQHWKIMSIAQRDWAHVSVPT
jgi:hypothetical protein